MSEVTASTTHNRGGGLIVPSLFSDCFFSIKKGSEGLKFQLSKNQKPVFLGDVEGAVTSYIQKPSTIRIKNLLFERTYHLSI